MRHTIRIYDNGGKAADRYTAVDMTRPEHWSGRFVAIGFDEDPFHPQGFGQHCTATPGRHLGKRIGVDALPPNARKFVEMFEQEGT